MRYYVQHGAGLGDLVADAVRADLGPVDMVFTDDSGMVFDSRAPQRTVSALPYLKNTFEVLGSVPRGEVPGSVDRLTKEVRKHKLLAGRRRGTPFRTMVNVDGKLIGLPAPVRVQLESAIAQQTGGVLNARGGKGVEFWVVGRRDLDLLLFCERLSVGGKKAAPRGSLHQDLATLLVKASDPRPDDVFLDPFAGSGSLVAARLELPYRKAVYSDLDLAAHRALLPPRITGSQRVDVLAEDALELPSIADGSVDAIVTDPPWGEHEQLDVPYREFARSMLSSFDRVLHPTKGRIVMLLSRRAAYQAVDVWERSPLDLRDTHDVLVNGHPASVLVGGR